MLKGYGAGSAIVMKLLHKPRCCVDIRHHDSWYLSYVLQQGCDLCDGTYQLSTVVVQTQISHHYQNHHDRHDVSCHFIIFVRRWQRPGTMGQPQAPGVVNCFKPFRLIPPHHQVRRQWIQPPCSRQESCGRHRDKLNVRDCHLQHMKNTRLMSLWWPFDIASSIVRPRWLSINTLYWASLPYQCIEGMCAVSWRAL